MLHIDVLSNNTSITPRLLLDDVIISNTGNVGLGANDFGAKLNILTNNNSALRIVDGNQGFQKKLVSDANGVAKWGNPKNTTHWIQPIDLIDVQPPVNDPTYSGKSITLSTRTWLIKYNLLWIYDTTS